MLAGRSPFDIAGASENPDQNTEDYLFQVILDKTIRIPRSLSVKAASVLKGFLNKSPEDRLGCHPVLGFREIATHPFFKSIDWEMYISSFNIWDKFEILNLITSVNAYDCHSNRVIDKIDQSEFEGFEYVNPLLMSMEDCV
ncbi:hypothetical protein J437_LFUL019321 [Ladona fulva]|uniref:AGC-kinase C-terminal domain-containing protein n=1 Tax=Ladona fulva TaxID=123851 RepID=A0A8K0KR02_LADFU|nr:hypothetical protein J437_LFUL019321 [Ladona fulva]